MHAFLLISQNVDFEGQIDKLAEKLHAKIMEFPLVKIDDVRSLNNLIRLSFNEPTLIVCPNIHEAGEEALNAFLKNLEEPQENIYFALTAPSIRKVLPTIVSRCQVVRISNLKFKISNYGDAEKLMGLSVGQRLAYIDKVKDRDGAVELAESLINLLHGQLHTKVIKYDMQIKNIEVVQKTLTRLKGNGNVNLQLSNMVIYLK